MKMADDDTLDAFASNVAQMDGMTRVIQEGPRLAAIYAFAKHDPMMDDMTRAQQEEAQGAVQTKARKEGPTEAQGAARAAR